MVIDLSPTDDPNAPKDYVGRGRPNEHNLDFTHEGHELELSRYLDRVEVVRKDDDGDETVLLVRSLEGSVTYRLRTVADDDDRMALEKPDGDGGWVRHLRVNVAGPFGTPNDSDDRYPD